MPVGGKRAQNANQQTMEKIDIEAGSSFCRKINCPNVRFKIARVLLKVPKGNK